MPYLTPTIIGAIAGDVIGAPYEWRRIKTTEFPLLSSRPHFTDDTVLTVAVADSILTGKDFTSVMREYGRKYPHAGYGGWFHHWLYVPDPSPYGSYGNGSAMRVSPVGFAYSTLQEVLEIAKRCAEVTHNHPEGIKGAQATAAAYYKRIPEDIVQNVLSLLPEEFRDIIRRFDEKFAEKIGNGKEEGSDNA